MPFGLGLTPETIVDLHEMDPEVPYPDLGWGDFSDELFLGDESTFGTGPEQAVWNIELLEDPRARSVLKGYCPGKSAEVYVMTERPDGTTGTYQAIMHWPLEQQFANGWNLQLVLRFTLIEELEEA